MNICRFLGCKDLTCHICSQNPNRQCSVNFNNKYLAGDILKAKCGASIFIEITDLHTGGVINDPEVTDNYYVEVMYFLSSPSIRSPLGPRGHCQQYIKGISHTHSNSLTSNLLITMQLVG